MQIHSELECKKYLREMRRQLGSFSSWGDERFTGIIVGNFFWVTYHSGYEWNRKFTNEKNRAYGFVRDCHGSTMVHCIRTKGYLDPISMVAMFAFLFCIWCGIGWFVFLTRNLMDYMKEILLPLSVIGSFFGTLIASISSYIYTGITERGIYGRYVLMALLHHPEDPDNHVKDYDE